MKFKDIIDKSDIEESYRIYDELFHRDKVYTPYNIYTDIIDWLKIQIPIRTEYYLLAEKHEPDNGIDVYVRAKLRDDFENYGITHKWAECLDMHVANESKISNEKLLAYVIFEMTYYGHSCKQCQEKMNSMFSDYE